MKYEVDALDLLEERVRRVAEKLKGRITQRGRTTANACELDLRSKEWAPLGWTWKTMRYPGAPGWPDAGVPITDRAVAESSLVLASYATHIAPQIRPGLHVPGLQIPTIAEAVEAYIAHLRNEKGPRHNTPIQWAASLGKHLVGPHGHRPLNYLTKDNVAALLNGMVVSDGQGGTKPAAPSTRANLRTAITSLWRHALPTLEPPFAGVTFTKPDLGVARRRAAMEGRILTAGKKKAYSPDEVLEILAWAHYLDQRNVIEMPNVAIQRVPNTTEAIAGQLVLATRIEELTFVRPRFFDRTLGVTYIPGTKTENATRWMIWFDAARPWIDRLIAVAPDDPEAFVLRTDPRDTRRRRDGTEIPPSRKTLGQRISQVLECAGLKFPRQATHIFRDTTITWLGAEGLDDRTIKVLVGHEAIEGITAKYLSAELFLRMLPDDIRSYHSRMPTQAAVAARAAELEANEAFERWQRGS